LAVAATIRTDAAAAEILKLRKLVMSPPKAMIDPN
jgi:hypothetical protein